MRALISCSFCWAVCFTDSSFDAGRAGSLLFLQVVKQTAVSCCTPSELLCTSVQLTASHQSKHPAYEVTTFFTMPSSLQSVTASCHLFFQESCNGQYKIFCKQNMLLVMTEEINNEAAKQAGRVWSWVCVRGRSVTCSIGSICCTELTSPRCSAEPSLDAAMCLHGLGSKCRRKCCLQLFLAQPQQPLMKC